MRGDYVITTINTDIRQGFLDDNPEGSIYQYPYDREALEDNYLKVFSVQRAFDLEVAAVWRKKAIPAWKSDSPSVVGPAQEI